MLPKFGFGRPRFGDARAQLACAAVSVGTLTLRGHDDLLPAQIAVADAGRHGASDRALDLDARLLGLVRSGCRD